MPGKRIIIAMVLFCLLCAVGIASAEVSIVPVSNESWTCYDYSVNLANDDPTWGVLLIGDNRFFRGVSHFVNYKLIDGDTVFVHDGLYDVEYNITDWQFTDISCYHFYVDGEHPNRYYVRMFDNRDVLINGTAGVV